MSTKNPRINITLKQADYDVIKRLSELTGTSMSKTINEYLEVVIPTLDRVADNLEIIKNSDKNIKEGLVKSVDDALARLETLNHYALSEYDSFNSSVDELVRGGGKGGQAKQ